MGRYLDLVADPNSELSRYGDRRQLADLVARFHRGDGDIARMLVHLINLELWLRDAAQPLASVERPRAVAHAS